MYTAQVKLADWDTNDISLKSTRKERKWIGQIQIRDSKITKIVNKKYFLAVKSLEFFAGSF